MFLDRDPETVEVGMVAELAVIGADAILRSLKGDPGSLARHFLNGSRDSLDSILEVP